MLSSTTVILRPATLLHYLPCLPSLISLPGEHLAELPLIHKSKHLAYIEGLIEDLGLRKVQDPVGQHKLAPRLGS